MGTRSVCGSVGLVGAVLFAALEAPAAAQVTTRISVDSSGAQGNGQSGSCSISADGRYVAFWSWASNLVSGDTNAIYDIFVRDRVAGTTERVSVSSSEMQANNGSESPRISADGLYVAFSSYASNLVGLDTNSHHDVFVRHRQSGVTERASVASNGAQANGVSDYPSISADGRYVAFSSLATNLASGDTNEWQDIFVRDRLSHTTERVSFASSGAQASGTCYYPAISADGRYVAFYSEATDLVSGDTNGLTDVFVRDRVNGTTERVSVSSSGGEANWHCTLAAMSADGRYVTFESWATNLVSADTNGAGDVFVHDRVNGTTERVSVDSLGTEGISTSQYASISADGRYVTFRSWASNLVSGDSNHRPDVFVHDRVSGTTTRVSVDSSGVEGNDEGGSSSISADGRSVAFVSSATNLVSGDTNAEADVFVRGAADAGVSFCSPGEAGIYACPCDRGTDAPHDPGHGCSNSVNHAGGLLAGTGTPLAGAGTDDVVLTATDITNGLTIFLEGPTQGPGAGLAFGDGIRCVTGLLKRFGTTIASSGTAAYPNDAGDPPISVVTGALAGETKYYQAYYRNPADWCNESTFNITNGYAIAWQ